MAYVTLTWSDLNSGFRQEDSIRVYRSDSPFDELTLPPVLATLPADSTEYVDTSVLVGEVYWYAVAMVKGSTVAIDFVNEVAVGEPTPFRNYFDSDFSTQPNAANAVWPCAAYDATSNKTYYAWLAEGAPQVVRIAAYDHATNLWSEPVTVQNTGLLDDTHGTPALVLDHQGYIYIFWGSHGSAQRWAISAAPRDISAWNAQTNLAGTYTYPKPVRFGSDLYLFMRVGSTSDAKFVVRKASPSGGVATFGAEVNLVDFTTENIGIYVTEVRAQGSEIEFVWCIQQPTPVKRLHVYYAAWNPATGALRNLSGSVSVTSGSLPVVLATANTSFRLVDSGSNITEIPTWCRDSAGNLHIGYFDGAANPFPFKHIVWNGSTLSSPVTVVSMNGRGNPRIRYVSLVPAGASVEFWYPDGAVGGWTGAGGDYMARKVWTAGTWGAEEVILTGRGVAALAHPSAVHNAHVNLKVIFGETAQTENYSDRFQARRYGYGSAGFAGWPEPADPYYARVLEHVVYVGANGSKPTGLDTSWRRNLLTWFGNAAIQSNRLACDGTGDGVQYGASGTSGAVRPYYWDGSNDNSGEFCIDLRRVKFNSTTLGASLYSRDGTSTSKSMNLYYRADLTPKKMSFEYRLASGTSGTLQFDFTPDTTKEYDFRVSRDTSGVLRMHYAESGSDLVLGASASIGTGAFNALTTRTTQHGSYDAGSARTSLNGSIGGVRVTMDHRGTTAANIPAAEMAFAP